ncbi:VTT domain-containing protein [Funiculus sociatus GB2-A5]|uniref:TVP38/TMEM64 family membrane protein n=1 Tax=Funiculus sociatus GB2-A5 TaxID=2933946 RepID=A0ABV0JXZ9_9CYAN|nr:MULTISPECIES: VTT domain-containing protein [unclassified Trichocoleus]MBD1905928.1 TVP38/TMEM64 family protein [Trichocoleus sp. FACHB-832]MBD2061181.1 TVP38/TMEM64 family protein [Trichocoleus sp. FACHB-6]
MKYNWIKILRWFAIGVLITLAIWLLNKYGIEQVREQVDRFGLWAPAIVFGLRFTSIIVPVLPGTAYAILAGGLFGFAQGLLVVALADLASCTFNFYIARRYGRSLVERFVGQQFIEKVDRLAQQHLERNFFLMTGLLMTGLFDFVAYAAGMTRMSWQSYFLALIVSILIAKPLWVAAGAGIFEGSQSLLGFAILGAFGIGIVTAVVQRQRSQ